MQKWWWGIVRGPVFWVAALLWVGLTEPCTSSLSLQYPTWIRIWHVRVRALNPGVLIRPCNIRTVPSFKKYFSSLQILINIYVYAYIFISICMCQFTYYRKFSNNEKYHSILTILQKLLLLPYFCSSHAPCMRFTEHLLSAQHPLCFMLSEHHLS